jgi:carbamoyltransferase
LSQRDSDSASRNTMSQVILAIHYGGRHDSAAAVLFDYEIKAAVALERLTRSKGDGGFPGQCIDEVLDIAGVTRRDVDVFATSRAEFPAHYFTHFRGLRWVREQFRTHVQGRKLRWIHREGLRANTARVEDFFDVASFRQDFGLRGDATVYFYNHHFAHALPALFYTDWHDALLVTADGGGDSVYYSHRHFAHGTLCDIYGGDSYLTQWPPVDSLGVAYGAATMALGFKLNRHESKLTGLAAFGEPRFAEEIESYFHVDEAGRVHSSFARNQAMGELLRDIAAKGTREDVAASIQKVLEDTMVTSVRALLSRYPTRRLGVAGGVFANVRLNRVLSERLPLEEIFIFPAMGDDGLPVGGALAYLLNRDGMARWLEQRHRLKNVYFGRDYTGTVDAMLSSDMRLKKTSDAHIALAARRLAEGEIGAIYTGRMEYGPRALGCRSILADPTRREINQVLNTRLARSEFMPFAPVVRADKADAVFDINSINAYATRFMTITCDVRSNWRHRIGAIVHVDNSARPQVLDQGTNPLYWEILSRFEEQTGIPVLVNTSFNAHEEPIVNKPAECQSALLDNRVDFVVTEQAIYERRQSEQSTYIQDRKTRA